MCKKKKKKRRVCVRVFGTNTKKMRPNGKNIGEIVVVVNNGKTIQVVSVACDPVPGYTNSSSSSSSRSGS